MEGIALALFIMSESGKYNKSKSTKGCHRNYKTTLQNSSRTWKMMPMFLHTVATIQRTFPIARFPL